MSSDRFIAGTLNPEAVRNGADDYQMESFDSTNFFTKLHEAMSRIGKNNTFAGVSRFRAVVLTTPGGGADAVEPTQQTTRRYTFRIRIPELHSCIPDPCAVVPSLNGAELDPRAAKFINMHPMAISADLTPEAAGQTTSGASLPRPSVGDIVWVQFEKGPAGGRMGSPVYVGIEDTASSRAGDGNSQPNNLSSACDVMEQLFSFGDTGTIAGATGATRSNYTSRNQPTPPTPAQAAAAERLGVDYEVIQAIEAVESGASASAIRFEPHLWHRYWEGFGLTEAQRDQMPFTRNANNRPVFSTVGSETNPAAFRAALEINAAAAVACTSFGLYQVMGYNFAGVNRTSAGNNEQALAAVARFDADPEATSYELLYTWFDNQGGSALAAARSHDWMTLAEKYNGPTNTAVYGPRLAREYAAFTGTTSTI